MHKLYLLISLVVLSTACTLNLQIEATSAAQQGDGTLTETLREIETTKTDADLDANIQPPATPTGL